MIYKIYVIGLRIVFFENIKTSACCNNPNSSILVPYIEKYFDFTQNMYSSGQYTFPSSTGLVGYACGMI